MLSPLLAVFEQGTDFSFLVMILAFFWGILSVLLCPCHLATLPLIVGMVEKNTMKSTALKESFVFSTLFSLGILLALMLVLAICFSPLWSQQQHYTYLLYYGTAIFLFYLGIDFLDILPAWLHSRPKLHFIPVKKHHFLWIGFFYGIALSPCTIGFMSPILAISFIGNQFNISSLSYLFMFCFGNVILIMLAASFTGYLQQFLNWSAQSKSVSITRKICGALLILAGFWTLYLI